MFFASNTSRTNAITRHKGDKNGSNITNPGSDNPSKKTKLNPSGETDENGGPGTDRTKKITVLEDKSLRILDPVGKFSISDILNKAKEDPKRFALKIPQGKKYIKLKENCRFCLPFMLGESCESTRCGFHLFINDVLKENDEPLPFFKDWLKTNEEFVRLSEKAANLAAFN